MKLVSVKHVRKPRGNNRQFVYARNVPKQLRIYDSGTNGKPRKRLEVRLGFTEADAVAAWPAVHERIEAKLNHYKALHRSGTAPRHRHERLKETIAKWHLDQDGEAHGAEKNLYYDLWFEDEMLPYLDEAKLQEKQSYPMGASKTQYLQCFKMEEWKKELLQDVWEYLDTQDATTLSDLFAYYRSNRNNQRLTSRAKKRDEMELDRLQRYLHDSVGDKLIRHFTWDDAQALKEWLLRKEKVDGDRIAVSSVKKYWKRYSAIWNLYAAHKGVEAKPFAKPNFPHTQSKGEGDEKSLPEEVLWQCIDEVIKGKQQIRTKQVWLLLLLTGARLSEICNLERDEIFLDENIPYIRIRQIWEDGQAVKSTKTDASVRTVPLTPLATALMREVLRSTNNFKVFGGWFDNSNTSSASLGKIVGKFRDGNKSYVTHSLRHNMRDRLSEHEPNHRTNMAIQGWTEDVGEAGKYGAVRLGLKHGALMKANKELEEKMRAMMKKQDFTLSSSDEKTKSFS
jgi:integrase